MSESERDTPIAAGEATNDRRPYEPPRIAWREPYAPVTSGVSCAKQPGTPGCNPGPLTA